MPKRPPDISVSRDLKAPQLEDVEAIAREEFARLPAEFRNLCGDLVIHVNDFPTEEVLKRMKIDDEFGLAA